MISLSSQTIDLTNRETEVMKTLRRLSSESKKFVVVAGYAVNALANAHRFSVDCDIVISSKKQNSFDHILKSEGYREIKSTVVPKATHSSQVTKYSKFIKGKGVSIDLYVISLVCRDTSGEWSYELLSKNSEEANVVGVIDSVSALVPKKELLIAMKIYPARDPDLRDVAMLSQNTNWNSVAEFANTGTKSKFLAQINSAQKKIKSKAFESSLKAGFGLKADVSPLATETLRGLML